jgi:hypothetical protein
VAHGQPQLRPTAPIERVRQVFERKIMNANYHRTGAERRGCKLYVQNIYWMFSQLRAERQWNSDQRRVRKSGPNFEIGPTSMEAIVCLGCCNVERVIISPIDLRERLNEVNGVAFIAPKLRPNRMSIDCYSQSGFSRLF